MTNVMDLVEDDLYNPLAIDLLEAVRQLQRIIPAENRLLDTKILDEYTFNSESVTKTAVLDKLSQCLLAPPYTLPMISVFRPIVIDLVARWLTPGFTNFLETDNNAVQKIELVAKAFSVILPVVPQVKRWVKKDYIINRCQVLTFVVLSSLAVRYFQNSPSLFERLNHLPNAESMETIKVRLLCLLRIILCCKCSPALYHFSEQDERRTFKSPIDCISTTQLFDQYIYTSLELGTFGATVESSRHHCALYGCALLIQGLQSQRCSDQRTTFFCHRIRYLIGSTGRTCTSYY